MLGRLDNWIASMLAWIFSLAWMLLALMMLLARMLALRYLVASILGRLVD
jgi:hypothetical protein